MNKKTFPERDAKPAAVSSCGPNASGLTAGETAKVCRKANDNWLADTPFISITSIPSSKERVGRKAKVGMTAGKDRQYSHDGEQL